MSMLTLMLKLDIIKAKLRLLLLIILGVILLSLTLTSCCLPFTFRAASYFHPSRRGVRSIIANANYTPEQAYVYMCNELMKNPKKLRLRTIPIPRFAIIDGKYFFIREIRMKKCIVST